jgi:Lon protease-like protein
METDSPERLDDLPIFPLGSVLFPGAVLPLHIFEDRYKKMMRYAVENGGRFGLSYREDAAVGRESIPELGSTGCVARINAVMPLDDGRMNIISTGLVRYRVLAFNQVKPYILARVEPFRDDPEPDIDLTRPLNETIDLVKEFLEIAQRLDESGGTSITELPEDPEDASLIIASALPLESRSKQALLEMTSARFRLSRLKQVITRMLPDFRERLTVRTRAGRNGHGRLE